MLSQVAAPLKHAPGVRLLFAVSAQAWLQPVVVLANIKRTRGVPYSRVKGQVVPTFTFAVAYRNSLLAQVRFRLTPQLIHQTFAEKPAVRRAFTANVPHNMDEKAFWTKYLRQQLKEQVRTGFACALSPECVCQGRACR